MERMQPFKPKTPNGFEYPYIPEGFSHEYVGIDNPYMQAAFDYARENSLDKAMPTSSVIVKDGKIIGMGANGSTFHETNVCERVKQNIPTGEGYELCEGCHPKNHSEPRAIQDAKEKGNDTTNAELYLWGHWWCCEPCWNSMQQAGITKTFLLENSDALFNKKAEGNIVGHQFDEK